MSDDSIETSEVLRLADGAYTAVPSLEEFVEGLSVDLAPFERARSELSEARAGADPEAFDKALQQWLRAAAVDTGALEDLYQTDRGFTLSVATAYIATEAMEVEKGKPFVEHFAAQLESFEMALDVATSARPVTEVWLREVHAAVTAAQETYRVHTATGVDERPLPRGAYKEVPNHVLLGDGSIHSYAPVSETPFEVARILEELRTPEFQAASSAVGAAYVHYVLSAIHPFSDGNGRVCRSVASVPLLREASVPLVIFADEKDRYLDALRAADRGDYSSFVRFIRDRAINTMREMADLLVHRRSTQDDTGPLQAAFVAENGHRHDRLDALADELAKALREAAAEAIGEAHLGPDVTSSVKTARAAYAVDQSRWRARIDGNYPNVSIRLVTPAPASSGVNWIGRIGVGTGPDVIDGFALLVGDSPVTVIGVDDIINGISSTVERRIRTVAERIVADLITELSAVVRQLNDKRGF